MPLVALVPMTSGEPSAWYTTKQAVSVADMLVTFRRALIAADSQRVSPSSLWVITEGRAHRHRIPGGPGSLGRSRS
jgi:hypothetical protein